MKLLVIRTCSKIHLMELGLVPGTEIVLVTKTFGMIVIVFRGAKFALRKEDFDSMTFYEVFPIQPDHQ